MSLGLYRTVMIGLAFGAALAAGAQTHEQTQDLAAASGVALSSLDAAGTGSLVLAPVSGGAGGGAQAMAAAKEFQPLAERRWEFGPFVNYGNGLIDRTDYHFFAAGFQMARSMFPTVHAGPFSGRFEFGGNIMPLWQAYTPAPHTEIVTSGDTQTTEAIGGGTYTGLSVTPVVFRWNFLTSSPRFTPWFQAQAGVVYTTHKFPPVAAPLGTSLGTSIFNFRSGAGIGFHYFTRPRRSVDFALNAEHLSNASLGDKNPGVNASLQFQLGYSWWK